MAHFACKKQALELLHSYLLAKADTLAMPFWHMQHVMRNTVVSDSPHLTLQGGLGTSPDCGTHLCHAELGNGVQEMVPSLQAAHVFWLSQGA